MGEPTTQQSDAGHFQVSLTSQLTPVAINRMHSWLLHVADANGTPVVDAEISISGGMPDHDHGLPTAPKVTRNFNNGDYLVEGVKFHMNGRWEFTVSVEAAAVRDVVTFEFAL